MNAIVLVLGGYQISIATYLRGVSTLICNLKEIHRLGALTASGYMGGRGGGGGRHGGRRRSGRLGCGGGDTKTMISPNTPFGDIITTSFQYAIEYHILSLHVLLYCISSLAHCGAVWPVCKALEPRTSYPDSIPGAGDKNKGLISLPCNIRRCAPRGSHIT